MKTLSLAGVLCMALVAPRFAAANDVWDLSAGGPFFDDGFFTDNELASGSEQAHDLQAHAGPVRDEDWYLIGQQPYSSYEVIVDGLTEEVAYIPATTQQEAIQLDLVDSAGTLINSGYAFSSINAARSLRFRNATATEVTDQYVRVRSGTSGCDTACTSLAQYRIHFLETTLLAPRFNNSATQITILILQNGASSSVSGTARFWDANGTLVGSSPFTMPAHGGLVLNTTTVPGVAGGSGNITIDHLGRFGSISGKAVALEPATGFTFDTAVGPKFN
jgi:hypothetical protein